MVKDVFGFKKDSSIFKNTKTSKNGNGNDFSKATKQAVGLAIAVPLIAVGTGILQDL